MLTWIYVQPPGQPIEYMQLEEDDDRPRRTRFEYYMNQLVAVAKFIASVL